MSDPQRSSDTSSCDSFEAGRAALAFSRDDLDPAIDLAERFLQAIPVDDRMERFGGLELLSLALTLRGDHDRASTVLAELRTVAARVGTKPMRASVRFSEGWERCGAS